MPQVKSSLVALDLLTSPPIFASAWHLLTIWLLVYLPWASLVAQIVESSCNVEDPGLIPGLGRSPGGGHGNPFRYSCLENPHGQKSLAGYSPWGHKESDTTEQQIYTSTICLRAYGQKVIRHFQSTLSAMNLPSAAPMTLIFSVTQGSGIFLITWLCHFGFLLFLFLFFFFFYL